MFVSIDLLGVYLHLARASALRRRPQAADRFLISGWERRLVAHNSLELPPTAAGKFWNITPIIFSDTGSPWKKP
jgi:hypothetical protein